MDAMLYYICERASNQTSTILARDASVLKGYHQGELAVWPSWVIYDTLYYHRIAEIGQHDWSKVDPSIYAWCFTGWAKNPLWCVIYVTLDHDMTDCPYASSQECKACRPSPYPSYASSSSNHRPSPKVQAPVCIKLTSTIGRVMQVPPCLQPVPGSSPSHPVQAGSQAPKDN